MPTILLGQSWIPDTTGLSVHQSGSLLGSFNVKFKPNGPFGYDWIYGSFWDNDSVKRCAAYRKGGKWHPVPFTGHYGIYANDIEQLGDTLLIGGSFFNVVVDGNLQKVPNTALIRVYNDSIWGDSLVTTCFDISVKNDSLLIWGSSFKNGNLIWPHILATDGGYDWTYPYSIVHPTETVPNFGSRTRLEILPNGHILTLNNGSASGSRYSGLVMWDGVSWHSFGNGLTGWTSQSRDFQYVNNLLYMGGTFNKTSFPQDPGEFIVRWNNNKWNDLATGTGGFVFDIVESDSILICHVDGGMPPHRFGDIYLSYLGGWDGSQWCGTPTNFQGEVESFGFVYDTLYVTFKTASGIDGGPASHIHWFEGDYFHGVNSVCSSLGLNAKEIEDLIEPIIYPNPTSGLVRIKYNGTEEYSIKVYNLQGFIVSESAGTEWIDLTNAQSGMYILEFVSSSKVIKFKIIKN